MANITTQREFERQWEQLINRIREEAKPFLHDSTTKKIARIKRAKVDKFYFAATYFPHYIQLNEEYLRRLLKQPRGQLYISPDAEIDWVKAGFSECHAEFFKLTELQNKFIILAGFRESAKDTLLSKIDVIHKLLADIDKGGVWFIPIVAFTEEHAATKVMPIKLEFENNQRLISDFGDMKSTLEWEQNSIITKNGRKIKGYGRDQTMRGQEHFGHRPDWIILNDIEDATKTTNPAIILKYVESIRQDVIKSVNSPRWGAILLCNYVSKQSIIHELMTGENTAHYGKYIFRALIPNEKRTEEERELAHQCRLRGYPDHWKSAWEFRHPTLRLLEEQKNDPETFDAEMMMRPKDRKNKKFKDTDFKFYTPSQIAGREMVYYTSIDPSAKEAADYKALITLGVPVAGEELEMYVVNAWIQQTSVDALLEATYEDFKKHVQKIIGVEMIGFASLLQRDYNRLMKKRGPLPIYAIEKFGGENGLPVNRNKEARIEGLVPYIRAGMIKFNLQQGDQGLLIRQLKAFPDRTPVSRGGLGDDGPDALSLCLGLIQEFPHGMEIAYETVQKRKVVFERGAY